MWCLVALVDIPLLSVRVLIVFGRDQYNGETVLVILPYIERRLLLNIKVTPDTVASAPMTIISTSVFRQMRHTTKAWRTTAQIRGVCFTLIVGRLLQMEKQSQETLAVAAIM